MTTPNPKWYWSGHDDTNTPLAHTISLLPPSQTPRQPQDTQSVLSYQPSDPSTPHANAHGGVKEKFKSYGMEDSQQTLIKQIRMINLKMGRDENAGIRKVRDVEELKSKPNETQCSPLGFHTIEPSPRYKSTLYLKPFKLPPLSIPTSISPSHRTSPPPYCFPLTLSERSVLKRSMNAKVQSTRQSLEDKMKKRLEKLNKLKIFPRHVNEFRVQSFVQFSLHREMQKSSLKEFAAKEREKVIETRNKKKPEGKLSKEVEANRRLLVGLEQELVDKLAWVEKHVPDSDDDSGPAIIGLTREQIDAKIAKMRADGKRRAPILAKTQDLPVLNIAKELA